MAGFEVTLYGRIWVTPKGTKLTFTMLRLQRLNGDCQ